MYDGLTLPNYLAGVADSDLFGSLAFVCLILILTSLHRRWRDQLWHRLLTFICLTTVVVMELVGSYYANLPPA
ncbi:hypothetical protein ACIOVF_16645 [Pseudomonas sp. NPDC087612]|uniref:Uncharacterized protein n=1 Tax=Pseudomonas vranovensis TaxID=321661 RepID=A0A423D7F0_9PSED|nr:MULTISPECIES: hypothetical protein [Pseudomonas]KJK16300.1 hypothetical protein UB48_18020 [Pseudomonas sp. 2(2015)]NLU59666.1 hypothetical protein [Pseudomonas sp. BIGb0427]QPG64426.1 hypothetical protein HFV04_006565 [Pseudomonas sp. BIGb0427]QVM96828.1 hypothetical protein JYG36_01135 [Pseudomonas sp. SORT22]ROL67472.1 hypothetical protein BHU25_18325 [Pseudomonas vranovensis]